MMRIVGGLLIVIRRIQRLWRGGRGGQARGRGGRGGRATGGWFYLVCVWAWPCTSLWNLMSPSVPQLSTHQNFVPPKLFVNFNWWFFFSFQQIKKRKIFRLVFCALLSRKTLLEIILRYVALGITPKLPKRGGEGRWILITHQRAYLLLSADLLVVKKFSCFVFKCWFEIDV